jgi:hypothetical protein
MSILGKIMDAIFGSRSASASTGGSSSSGGTVDMEAVLTKAAAAKKEKLDWKHSIVDLMKVLDLDSSLSARQALAKELKYTGDMKDSAKMNMWLHKQVIAKVAANGGVVPADLKD